MDNFTHKHALAYIHICTHTGTAHTNMWRHIRAHTYMQAYTWAPAHTNTGNKNQNDFYAWAGRSPWSLDDPQPSSESHQQQQQERQ